MQSSEKYNSLSLKEKILYMKKERNAVILAHNYQRPEVQDIADFTDDSYGLAKAAAATKADTIVFCGVHFMAETAAMLNPGKIVLLPDAQAGCPMADMIDVKALIELKKKHPGATVMCYINSSAAVKAESDICCTSSNAVRIAGLLQSEEIIFVPDKSLGAYIAAQTQKIFHLYPGYCPTHHRLFEFDVIAMKEKYPDAHVMAHPECTEDVLKLCDFVGSTTAILRHAKESTHKLFLVGTEEGILHRLKKDNPQKTFHLLTDRLVCPNMKLTTLKKILWSLEDMKHQITVPEEIRARALSSIEKMLNM